MSSLDGMTGELTTLDIENGISENCSDCPFALALGRFFEEKVYSKQGWKSGQDFYVSVDYDRVELIRNGEELLIIDVGTSVVEWLEKFDEGQAC